MRVAHCVLRAAAVLFLAVSASGQQGEICLLFHGCASL